jgi:signal transduction histidine kinase/HPt (histidine-containing phosphotransfer) domain-containing protein
MKPSPRPKTARSEERAAWPDGAKPARGKRFVSVGTKLTGGILAVLAIVTAVAYLRVNRHEREQMLSAKERAATMVTELFAAGVTAPLSFNDDAGVREHIALLMASTNVAYVGSWRADGARRRGEKIGDVARGVAVPRPPSSIPARMEVKRTADTLTVQRPVVSETGEVLGAVLIEWSLAEENAAIAAEQRSTLVTFSATALGLAIVVVALSRLLVVGRLAQLASAAKRLEEGAVVDIRVDSNDEVGSLSRAFASMSRVIATREAQISQRNRDLRRVLDNVAEGLMTVRKDGSVSDERSRAIDDWFGTPAAGVAVFEYLAVDQPTADVLCLGWMALNDDFMPVEAILDQMRVRFQHRQRSFELDFSPIWLGPEEHQVLDEVLVVVRDVTAVVERERAEIAQREALRVFRRVLVDPVGFRDFLRNGASLVLAIEQQQQQDSGTLSSKLKRDIHTLKGDTGLYGIESIANVCHRIESQMEELHRPPSEAELATLRAAWSQLEALAAELENGSSEERLELSLREYEEHVAQLKALRVPDDLLANVRSWLNEPAERTLRRFVEQAKSLARQLGKSDTLIEMRVAPAGLRLSPARWAPVWAVFSHVLRNTLDHGVETRARRSATSKPARARVEIALTASKDGIALSVTDDGRGIDWEKVRQRADELGLPHTTQAELEEALYGDGVTTREQVTEASGRGLGMGAVRDVVRLCDGEISLESRYGFGTTVTLWFPSAMLEQPRSSLSPKTPTQVGSRIGA